MCRKVSCFSRANYVHCLGPLNCTFVDRFYWLLFQMAFLMTSQHWMNSGIRPNWRHVIIWTQCLCISLTYMRTCARSRYQGQGQIITPHNICGIYLLALDSSYTIYPPYGDRKSLTPNKWLHSADTVYMNYMNFTLLTDHLACKIIIRCGRCIEVALH